MPNYLTFGAIRYKIHTELYSGGKPMKKTLVSILFGILAVILVGWVIF